MRWGRRKRHVEDAHKALYNEDLVTSLVSARQTQAVLTHNELARVKLGYLIVIQPFTKVEKRARNILVPYKSLVIVSQIVARAVHSGAQSSAQIPLSSSRVVERPIAKNLSQWATRVLEDTRRLDRSRRGIRIAIDVNAVDERWARESIRQRGEIIVLRVVNAEELDLLYARDILGHRARWSNVPQKCHVGNDCDEDVYSQRNFRRYAGEDALVAYRFQYSIARGNHAQSDL